MQLVAQNQKTIKSIKRETTMKSENNRLMLKVNSNNIEQNWVLTTFLMLTNVTMSLKLIKS